MTKRVTVTGAEQSAARNIVKRNAARGVATRSSVTKIANAVPRSAASGRYASKAATKGPRAS
ncbi:hypothetical protein GCM10023339_41090 [Alloalcanivorax gelatiniphagus]